MKMPRAYGSAQGVKTASYQEGEVSLPSGDRQPVEIAPLIGDTARRFLDELTLCDGRPSLALKKDPV